jgi:hypothetical protein
MKEAIFLATYFSQIIFEDAGVVFHLFKNIIHMTFRTVLSHSLNILFSYSISHKKQGIKTAIQGPNHLIMIYFLWTIVIMLAG